MLLSELAARLGLDTKGPDVDISGVNTLDKAGPGDLTFLANPKYAPALASTRAAAVILDRDNAHLAESAMLSDNVYLDLARAVHLFARPRGEFSGVSPVAFVHPEAELGAGVDVGPLAHVGARARIGDGCRLFPGAYVGEDCDLGQGCVLYPNSVVMSGCRLGSGVALQPGAVVGGDGFGYAPSESGITKIPQVGIAVLADNVEIGANAAVDRGSLDATEVGENTKIDNLVQIAHNVRVGKNCMFVSQSGVAGSTRIGDNVILAGQVGLVDNLTIGSNVRVGAQAGVSKNLPDNFVGAGAPVMEEGRFRRAMATLTKLPELRKRVAELEKKLARLEGAGRDGEET